MNKKNITLTECIAWHHAGLLTEAKNGYLSILQQNPKEIVALHQLGNIYFSEGKFEEAIDHYQAVITLKADKSDAYYNLALAYYKNKQWQEASRVYQSLLELNPLYEPARFQLARIMMEHHQYEEAIKQLVMIKEQQFQFETLANLAVCFLQLGQLNEAEAYYVKALAIEKKDSQILFNLGVINAQLGKIKRAISFYVEALKMDPALYDAHHNLGVAYLMLKNKEQALIHFRKVQEVRPSIAIRHIIEMILREENMTHIPAEYVSALFDSYADHYDKHLLDSLHYEVQTHVTKALQHIGLLEKNSLDILELGCGTGLGGLILKPLARHLIGVDLSSKMLEKAQQKNIYDQLVHRDALSFLKEKKAAFNLILAADVLGYIGELSEIFVAVYKALAPNSWFVFTVEKEDQKKFLMTQSGRFAYHEDYLAELAKQTGFVISYQDLVYLRTQEEIPVMGYLYLLTKH